MHSILPRGMLLLGVLSQVSVLRLTVAILASFLSGIAAMGATICVLESFRSSEILWWEFAAVAAFSVVIGRYSRVLLGRMASQSTARMRRRLIRSVLHAPLLDLERIGATRLLVAFTNDLVSIGTAVRHLATLVASVGFLLVLLGYIGWLSPARMIVTAILCFICITGGIILRRLERKHRHAASEAWDKVVHVWSMVVDGVKQLKLDRPLARRALLSFQERLGEQQQFAKTVARRSDLIEAWIQSMFYLILGAAVFGPFGDEGQLKLGLGLLALLRIRAPLRSLIVDTRAFNDASIALQRIMELGLTLTRTHLEHDSPQPKPAFPRYWRSLELEGVTFKYEEKPEDNFALGPLEISFHPGEIVFIVGENGSGKTTLAKVLTGLYAPTSGTIRLDGTAVDDRNANWYRSKFAAVFGDFCLFEGVADLNRGELDHEAAELAVWLKLHRWMPTTPDSSGKSTALSSGERRRIALLMALLQDRPLVVFDEWAADQDPRYKDFFYGEVLSRLRDSGKLVVVISNDEEYFHTADRVLWLEREKPPTWRSPLSFGRSPMIGA